MLLNNGGCSWKVLDMLSFKMGIPSIGLDWSFEALNDLQDNKARESHTNLSNPRHDAMNQIQAQHITIEV
ncbi:unnamed protein product [Dovyalis caffra]|uniref:Uncharacterized protein n=1 Tax=Dovyalis caffra TaxID=77055 RepID=A0AAV1R9F6_9ROSI|nr:unnamed protein product [Dovyalis caffra]